MKKFIISLVGFSGTGKSLAAKILEEEFGIPKVVSCTTRKPRPGEKHGVDYYFVTEERFSKLKKLEFDKYADNYYGLLKKDVDNLLNKHKRICTITTLSGVESLKEQYPGMVYSVFINTKVDELRKRLENRGESEEEIEKRMKQVKREQMDRLFCQYEIINDFSEVHLRDSLKSVLNRIEKEKAKKPSRPKIIR